MTKYKTFSKGTNTADRDVTTVGTVVKHTFIYTDRLLLGHKSVNKLLKTDILTMHGINFQRNFLYESNILKYITFKVIDRTEHSLSMP